jgi:hypothetical protein
MSPPDGNDGNGSNGSNGSGGNGGNGSNGSGGHEGNGSHGGNGSGGHGGNGAEVLVLPRDRPPGGRGGRRRRPLAARGVPPLPDPPPGLPPEAFEPPPSEEPSLEERVTSLAAKGLDEAEIRARLGLPATLDEPSEHLLSLAYRRGQLLGRARVKEALFNSALQGRVTAQLQVLRRLGEPLGDDEQDLEAGAPGGPSVGEPAGPPALEADRGDDPHGD